MGLKKRKRNSEAVVENGINRNEVDTSKPTAVFEAKEGRAYTLSIALPGSIIANAQTAELQTLLAGQIARALAVFCVDEVVVFDDGQAGAMSDVNGVWSGKSTDSYTGFSDPNFFLTHVLSYLETPPHLRKHLFPIHPDLRLAGSLPSLDMPHHVRRDEWCQYREGVTKAGDPKGTKKVKAKYTSVETGLRNQVFVPASIPPDTRVTVKFVEGEKPAKMDHELSADVVSPSAPREEAGYYWGYNVRSAASLSAVLTECPYDGGYDLTIGTSERGVPVSDLTSSKSMKHNVPDFSHMMIIFGGVAGLEVAVKADTELEGLGVKSPEALFDHWVDLCPGQGSRTIRTEEAVWLGLMGLRELVLKKGKR